MLFSKSILIATSAAAALVAGTTAMTTQSNSATPAPFFSEAGIAVSQADIVGEQAGPSGVIPAGSVSALIETGLMEAAPSPDTVEAAESQPSPLLEAYATRIFDPIWSRSGARDLQVFLRDAERRGIAVDPALMDRVDLAVNALASRNPAERAEADILLSRVFIAAADHMRNGPLNDVPELTAQIEAVDPEPLHRQLAFAGEGRFDYRDLDPAHPEYTALLEAREIYVRHVEQGGFTPVPDIEGALELGDEHAVLETVRQRLREEGFAPEPSRLMLFAENAPSHMKESETPEDDAEDAVPASHRFDAALEAALIDFQEHNGLETDGVLGPNTIAALNVTAEEKLARIDANLERWRWAPRDFGDTHVRVNIPAFRVDGYENARATISMRSIVGMRSRQTPIFSDSIEHIVANPRWYVPESILQRDKLDDIRSNPDFLANGGYYVLDRQTGERVDGSLIDWNAEGVADQYRLVQNPSARNALGPVKIMFPNRHSVYLHGTPSQSLFDRSIRAFSSGCIRLEHPEDMARWVARAGGADAGVTAMNAAWDTGEELRVDLDRPIPVYILYYTVEMDDQGGVMFHRDIYDRDEALITALAEWELTLPGNGES
ncbi:L,D-transpeptidase family protein [Hyphobacterium marinum]|uniref:L,D-transpeptidase family protein n=1 Tax=Hyphobacterium marinum TaxID=3116574 RepID=A0ABU7LZJ7_9PROT|nr:L,D-transpeptidase family protein [Hyphobacterium sp. Y6023]MEE2566866.1 L,D-transpeptidase family protein [Hyphobacterium sp. Y6023]